MPTGEIKGAFKKVLAKAMKEYEVWYKKWKRKMGGK